MANLEQAADALVKKLLEFRSEAEGAAEQLEGLREGVEEHEEELGDDWSGFTDAVQALLRTVEERSGRLAPAGDEAASKVEQLGGVIAEVKESLEQSLETNEEQLDSLRDQAEGLDGETERLVGEGAENPSTAVGEQLEAVLEGVRETAKEGVESIREGFVKQAEETAGGAELLVDATVKILADNGNWVRQTVVAWTAKMTEVEDSVALEGYEKAEKQAPEVVDYAIETLQAAQREALAEVERLVGEAREALGSLEEALEESSGGLQAAAEGLTSTASDLDASIGEASAALDRVTQVLVDHRAM